MLVLTHLPTEILHFPLQAKYPQLDYKITVVQGQVVAHIPVVKIIIQHFNIKTSINNDIFAYQGGKGIYGHPSTSKHWKQLQQYVPKLSLYLASCDS
jgi:hypothetical protein